MADLSDLIAQIENVGAEAFVNGQQALGEEAQAAAPVVTGELRDSLELTVGGVGSTVTGTIAFLAPQAGWTNDGTRPHEITGDPLVFEVGGQTVFVTRVSHPGYAGSEWFDKAVTDDTWAAAVQQALDGLSG